MKIADSYIISKCLNGDSASFGLLVDRYREGVYALAYSKLRNFHDAEDVAQEAFIKAYRNLHTLRSYDSFHAWLHAITANLCKDWIRLQSRRPDREFIEDQEVEILELPSIDSYRESSVFDMIHEALESLPEIYRQVLTLYYLGGMNNKEIAEFLGASTGAIKERLSRARSQMKEEVIAMMNDTFKQRKLPVGFTFRILETIKHINVKPIPQTPWISWAISLVTAGLSLLLMGWGSYVSIQTPAQSYPMYSQTSVKTYGEIPVSNIKPYKLMALGAGTPETNKPDNSPAKPGEAKSQGAQQSDEKLGSDAKYENIPALFTNRKELASSRKPDFDCYGFHVARISFSIRREDLNNENRELWDGLSAIMKELGLVNKPLTEFSSEKISEQIARKYPKVKVKILFDEWLNLTRRVDESQLFLPSVIKFIAEKGENKYMGFMLEQNDKVINVLDILSKDIDKIIEYYTGKKMQKNIPAIFPIDAKFQKDLESGKVTAELAKEFEKFGIMLSSESKIIADTSGGWRIITSYLPTFLVSKEKNNPNILTAMIIPTRIPTLTKEDIWIYEQGCHSIMPGSENLVHVDAGCEMGEEQRWGYIELSLLSKATPEYITIRPGEILDASKPPILSIDPKYVIKAKDTDK